VAKRLKVTATVMSKRVKIAFGCSIALAAVVAAMRLLIVVADNGTYGNNAYINLSRIRGMFVNASAGDFEKARITVTDTPRLLSSSELNRLISVRAPDVHSTDPWCSEIKVYTRKATNAFHSYGNRGFCEGHIVMCVGKGYFGGDLLVSETF
jgi:hypothetical protein